MNHPTISRIAAACVAASAWAGLAFQIVASYHLLASVPLTLWVVFAYFTIITNLLVAVIFTALSADRSSLRSSWIVAGAMLSIVLVGVIYALLLHGSIELSGGSAVANVLLHMVTPILVPLFWIAFTPKGNLTWRHPILWAIYPLAYLVYALIRGAATGRYAYPFLDVLQLGWRRTALNSTVIALVFLLSGWITVWIDHRLGARPASPTT